MDADQDERQKLTRISIHEKLGPGCRSKYHYVLGWTDPSDKEWVMLSQSDSGKFEKGHLHGMGFLSFKIEKCLDWLSNERVTRHGVLVNFI
jgi:hypothetical protein